MQRGLLAGRVTVEGEDDARAQLLAFHIERAAQLHRAERIVGDQTAHDLGVLVAERGAACGDRGVDARQVHGHHVGVALHDHHLAFVHDLLLGQVDAVEHLVLVVELRVRRIDVFRVDLVVVIQLARAESQGAASGVADRPRHTPAEIVVHAPLALAGQTGVEHLLLREPLVGQVAHQIVPSARRVAAAEPRAIGLRKITAGEQFAGGQRFVGHQLRHKEPLGLLVRLKQARALGAFGFGRIAGLVVMQLDVVAVGEQLHRLAEIDVLLLFDVFEHVAAAAAAEAVPHAHRRAHAEARGLFVVEWAQAHIRPDAGGLQRHRGGDDLVQIGRVAYFLNVFFVNHARHGAQHIRRPHTAQRPWKRPPWPAMSTAVRAVSWPTRRSGSPPGRPPRAAARHRLRRSPNPPRTPVRARATAPARPPSARRPNR